MHKSNLNDLAMCTCFIPLLKTPVTDFQSTLVMSCMKTQHLYHFMMKLLTGLCHFRLKIEQVNPA